MQIYFFALDENKLPYAGCKLDNGKRVLRMIWNQYGHYISTGSAVNKDRARHYFTPEQEAAYDEFIASGAMTAEFFTAPK